MRNELPGGLFGDEVIESGDDAYPANKFIPSTFPWVVGLALCGESLIISPSVSPGLWAQMVVEETSGSFAWRPQDIKSMGRFEDAEDLPHSNAFELTGLLPPKLPRNVRLSPRSIQGEYMFYLGPY